MTAGIFVSRAPAGRPRCARCGRPFMPRKAGDLYGEKCARKMAGQIEIDSQALVSGKVLRKRTFKDKPDPECPVDPEVCPGDCGYGMEEDPYLSDIPEIEEVDIV